jgi:hypothetical protein
MNCLFLILSLLTLVGTFAADINVYKKDFESTGKAFFFTPSDKYQGYKIAVGEQCTKVVVYIQDANGLPQSPSETNKLSTYNGIYTAEIIRYPGGKCALPDTQKYGKEIITSSPEDLVNYYNGKQGPLDKYVFKTEDKATPGVGTSLLKNKWILIGVGSGALLLILVVVGIVVMSRRGGDDEYSRFSSNDKDMQKVNEPYNLLSNNDSNYKFSDKTFTMNSYSGSNWNSDKDIPIVTTGSSDNLLGVPEEPKRINSITFEEQQNYSDMMKKHMEEDRNKPMMKSAFGISIPDEYEKFKTFKVVRKFTPQRNDELVVENGHMVKMIKSFEDGWSLCYNIDTGKEGYIPKNKLAAMEQPQKPQTIFHSDTTSTTSSAYSTKPLLHSNSGASSNYSNNNSYGRKRAVNNRNNSSSSRDGGYRSSPKNQANKYYRKPSNDNYTNGSYGRNQNRYDM